MGLIVKKVSRVFTPFGFVYAEDCPEEIAILRDIKTRKDGNIDRRYRDANKWQSALHRCEAFAEKRWMEMPDEINE